MRINSVNNQTSFGRAIKVIVHGTTNTNPAAELVNVLNSKKSKAYNKKEAQSIRAFFMTTLVDYNGKDNIILRNCKNNAILLSGKDAQAIKKEEKKYEDPKNHQDTIENEILKRLENGQSSKPESYIHLDTTNSGKKKIRCSHIKYIMSDSYFTAMVDGFIRRDVEPTQKYTKTNKSQNFIGEQRDLFLNTP